ncbi:MAG: hypothetical protein KH452_02895 [Clostridiales bacterium]|nr:hypothetical protein [Clostridiales bacterium]
MNLMSRIPKEFYKLFGSKYMDYYMIFLTAIYEESSSSYSTLGLTEQECRMIINEKLASATIDWSEERFDEEGSLLTRSNMASVCLSHFESWGWLKQDFDETLNSYVVSFPEYSQLYVELFQKLCTEEDSKERESVLAVYSYLFTYSSDAEKNNEILKSALKTSRRLVQMMANMQEGMRGYFDELSQKRDFRGIQEVLVREINNSDSRRYAILTTTDSFYRYKEAVKELIDQNLSENELRRQKLEQDCRELERRLEGEAVKSPELLRKERAVEKCEEAMDIICRIEREFDTVERRYNKLIEQKTVFAGRAAARIRYILQEGVMEEDQTVALVNLLSRSSRREEILEELAGRMRISSPYRVITDRSFYSRRDREQEEFKAVPVPEVQPVPSEELDAFVLKPLYTQREIRDFLRRNQKDGVFLTTEETVQTMEDLEKLFFVWQDATELSKTAQEITVGDEIKTREGLSFSSLRIEDR